MNIFLNSIHFRAQKRERPTASHPQVSLVSDSRCVLLVSRMNRAHRANTGASAAIKAKVRINVINIAFYNSTCRALADASTASYAL